MRRGMSFCKKGDLVCLKLNDGVLCGVLTEDARRVLASENSALAGCIRAKFDIVCKAKLFKGDVANMADVQERCKDAWHGDDMMKISHVKEMEKLLLAWSL